MHAAYRRFSWGLLWIMLDIRIAAIDVLPDIVGYALVWSAIDRAGHIRAEYRRARPYAIALTFLAIAGVVLEWQNPEAAGLVPVMPLAYGSFTQFLMLLTAGRFLGALAIHASDRGAAALAEIAQNRWRFYFVLNAAALLVVPFLINSPKHVTEIGNALAGAAGLVSTLVLFFTCRRAAREAPLTEP